MRACRNTLTAFQRYVKTGSGNSVTPTQTEAALERFNMGNI
jgi:hypothetical protein